MEEKAALNIIKGECPECGNNRNAKVVGEASKQWDEGDGAIYFGEKHRLLQCLGCETIYHQSLTWNSEEVVYYGPDFEDYEPREIIHYWHEGKKKFRELPQWIAELELKDSLLYNLFVDANKAFNLDLGILSTIGLRVTIDRATELLDIDTNFPFAKKLDELERLGQIGPAEKDKMSIVIEAGNAAAHRGWSPSASELDFLFETTEAFLRRVFLLPVAATAVRQAIPKKTAKGKKTNSSDSE